MIAPSIFNDVIMNGGEPEITMGSKPGTIWGVGDANKAVSAL